jgi:hypothetical protein
MESNNNNNNNIEYYARRDRMLRTIAESDNLCACAQHHYRHAAYDLNYSFYNHRVIEIGYETMDNAVQQAHIGTAKLKSSFSRLRQDDSLRRQFPVLTTIPTIPDLPQSPRMNSHCRQTDHHQSKELLYRNVIQFIRRCEEICFHQQNVIAAVAVQIQAEMTTRSSICGGGSGEGGRHEINNDEDYQVRRPAPDIPIGEEEQGGQLEPIPFVSGHTVESINYEGGGNIPVTPDTVYTGYCSTATVLTAAEPTTATSNARHNENDHGDHDNNNCHDNFSLALGGRDDFLRRRDSLFGQGRSHHHDVGRNNDNISNDNNTDNDSAFGVCRRSRSDNEIFIVDDRDNNDQHDSNDDDSAVRRSYSG